MAKARVYDAKEFVEWFERQIKKEMKCHNVYVEYIEISCCDVIVVFDCGNKAFMAIITEGDKFRVSVYRIRRNRIVRKSCKGKGSITLARGTGFSLNNMLVLFYVEDGVNIDVHEIPEVKIYL